MEEAEALSTKMGILVKGGIFKCYGSSQHIKNKFGTGYVIELKICSLKEDQIAAVAEQYLPGGAACRRPELEDPINEQVGQATLEATLHNDKVRIAHYETNLYLAVLELCKVFRNVDVIEKYSNYIRVRVDRLDKSIGSVFGLVEGFKTKFNVSEYSVSQTTLEQIFQNFADLKFEENVEHFSLNASGQLHQTSSQTK